MAKLGRGAKKRYSAAKKRKTSAKKVAEIAKKVVMRNVETKYFRGLYAGSDKQVLQREITSYNLFYHDVAQGDTINTMTGNKVFWKQFICNISYSPSGNSASGGIPLRNSGLGHVLHYGIIKCRTLKTTTSLAFSDILDASMQAHPDTGFLEEGQAAWVVHKKVNIRPRAINTAVSGSENSLDKRQFKLVKTMNLGIAFKNLQTGSYELENKYYYYFVYYAIGDGAADGNQVGTIRFQYRVTFKDA